MPTPSNYTNSLQESVSAITGKNAPKTGEYYEQIYSGIDSNTGAPVVGVNLKTQRNSGPTPLDGLRDAEILNIVLNNNQKESSVSPTPITTTTQLQQIDNDQTNTSTVDGGGLPLGGIIIFILLLGLVWLIYSIIRIWQNTQAQKAIMQATTTGVKPIVEVPSTPISTSLTDSSNNTPIQKKNKLDIKTIETNLLNENIELQRKALNILDEELNKLLTSKNIEGDTLSDKLRVISAGEFALIDLAWEAHQITKNLLAMHDEQLITQDLSRVLKLFKQVFAEHDVI